MVRYNHNVGYSIKPSLRDPSQQTLKTAIDHMHGRINTMFTTAVSLLINFGNIQSDKSRRIARINPRNINLLFTI
jgi:hypothetical protein